MPHPTTGEPLGQDEKDRLGAAERARRASRRAAAPGRLSASMPS